MDSAYTRADSLQFMVSVCTGFIQSSRLSIVLGFLLLVVMSRLQLNITLFLRQVSSARFRSASLITHVEVRVCVTRLRVTALNRRVLGLLVCTVVLFTFHCVLREWGRCNMFRGGRCCVLSSEGLNL